MAWNVVVTDGKTTVIAACVETLALAVHTGRSFLNQHFYQEMLKASKARGISDDLRKKRKLWVQLVSKARKLGFGKGVFVEQV